MWNNNKRKYLTEDIDKEEGFGSKKKSSSSKKTLIPSGYIGIVADVARHLMNYYIVAWNGISPSKDINRIDIGDIMMTKKDPGTTSKMQVFNHIYGILKSGTEEEDDILKNLEFNGFSLSDLAIKDFSGNKSITTSLVGLTTITVEDATLFKIGNRITPAIVDKNSSNKDRIGKFTIKPLNKSQNLLVWFQKILNSDFDPGRSKIQENDFDKTLKDGLLLLLKLVNLSAYDNVKTQLARENQMNNAYNVANPTATIPKTIFKKEIDFRVAMENEYRRTKNAAIEFIKKRDFVNDRMNITKDSHVFNALYPNGDNDGNEISEKLLYFVLESFLNKRDQEAPQDIGRITNVNIGNSSVDVFFGNK